MLVLILLRQILIMAILCALGLYLTRKGRFSPQTANDLGGFMLRIILPVVVIHSYITPFSEEKLISLGQGGLLTAATYLISFGTAWLIFGRRRPIDNFGTAFTQAGFIGIPLVIGLIGEKGVFYIAPSIAMLNIFQWTYGTYILTGRRELISLRSIIMSPMLGSFIVGLVIFISRIPVPAVITQTLGYIASMNTPIAMLLLGSFMSKLTLRQFLDFRPLQCILARLVLVPALVFPIMVFFNAVDPDVRLAVYLGVLTSVAANLCVYAQQFGCDYEYSVVAVCQSAVLSVVTIPLWFILWQVFVAA